MTAASTDEMKAAMRVQMRDAVARIRPFARAQRAEALESTVLRSPALVGARIVLAYRAMPDEIAVDGIVRTLAGRGVRVAFPRVSDHGTLQLLEIAAKDPLDPALWTLDRYGIAAPNAGLLCARSGLVRALHPREIDAVIVPGRNPLESTFAQMRAARPVAFVSVNNLSIVFPRQRTTAKSRSSRPSGDCCAPRP